MPAADSKYAAAGVGIVNAACMILTNSALQPPRKDVRQRGSRRSTSMSTDAARPVPSHGESQYLAAPPSQDRA